MPLIGVLALQEISLATWNLRQLKDRIEIKYGKNQQRITSRSLDSIFENQDFARYHYSEIKKLISEHLDNKRTGKDYFQLVMSTDPTVRESEYQFSTSCKAHIISLLRNLHSIPDLLAHFIYFCLGFNINDETRLDESKVSLFNVKKILKKDPKYRELLELVMCLTVNEDFKYLKDIGNYSKHRANVIPKLSYSMEHEGNSVYKFTFEAFKRYPETPAVDFLNREYNRESEQILVIGNKINEIFAM